MRYKLHLAATDNMRLDIPMFEFNNIDELTHKLINNGLPDDRVWLTCIEDSDDEELGMSEIFISENYLMIREFIETYEQICVRKYPITVYFQQYRSYEDAYAVALDMKEENKICYNQESELN
jgi:hypothetical protein